MRIPGFAPPKPKTESAPKPAASTGGTQANTVKPRATQPSPAANNGISTFTAAPARAKVELNAPSAAGSTTPAVADPVQEAATRVREAGTRGPAAAMDALRVEAEKLGDPAQVDALLQACRVEVESAADTLADRVQHNKDDSGSNRATRDIVEDMAAIADLAGEAGTRQIADTVAQKMAGRLGDNEGDLNQFDDAFRELADKGQGSKLALAVAERMINGTDLINAGNSILDAGTQAIGKVTGEYKTAQAGYAQHEARLAQDLTGFGPGMTEEEKRKYTEEFWKLPEHADAKARMEAAENKLAHAMEAGGPQLEQLARQGDPDAAKMLMEGYEALSTSIHHADDALAFVADVNKAENADLLGAIDKSTDGDIQSRMGENIVAVATPRAQGEAIAQAEMGDPQGLEAFSGLIEAIGAGSNMKDLATEVRGLGETLRQLRENPGQARFDTLVQDWQDKSKLGKAMAIAGVAAGIYTAATDPSEVERIKAGLGAVKGGLEITAGVLGTFGTAAKVAGVAELAGKFVPYLGLTIDAIQMGQDIHALMNDPNAGEAIAAFGTGVSLLGDLAGCVPILGTLPDGALGIAGELIHTLGGFISGIIEGNEAQEKLDQERAALLQKAGVPPETRELLTGMDPRLITQTQLGQLGMDREDFLSTLQGMRDATGDAGEGYLTAMSAAAAFGLKGDEAKAFIDTLRAEFARNPQGMRDFENAVGWLDYYSDGVAHDNGGSERGSLTDQLQTVQYAFARDFPNLATQYGTSNTTVEDINVGYYAAA
ncbi:MAG: hypothetical protein ACJ8AT_30285 [Hyalangium sp.]|uniref:hypothetical protein n=1 Tax=Hyalangium sp. TaxID=2028555 RepID=UPI003899C7FE